MVAAAGWDGCRMVGCELLLWCLGSRRGAAIAAEGGSTASLAVRLCTPAYTTQTVCDQARRVVSGQIRQPANVWPTVFE